MWVIPGISLLSFPHPRVTSTSPRSPSTSSRQGTPVSRPAVWDRPVFSFGPGKSRQSRGGRTPACLRLSVRLANPRWQKKCAGGCVSIGTPALGRVSAGSGGPDPGPWSGRAGGAPGGGMGSEAIRGTQRHPTTIFPPPTGNPFRGFCPKKPTRRLSPRCGRGVRGVRPHAAPPSPPLLPLGRRKRLSVTDSYF